MLRKGGVDSRRREGEHLFVTMGFVYKGFNGWMSNRKGKKIAQGKRQPSNDLWAPYQRLMTKLLGR